MNSKSLNISSIGILALLVVLSLGFVSATLNLDKTDLTFNPSTTPSPQSITITNPDSTVKTLTFRSTLTIQGRSSSVTFNIAGNKVLNATNNYTTTITLTPSAAISPYYFDYGVLYSEPFLVSYNDGTDLQTVTVSIENNEYCDYFNINEDLSVNIRDVSVTGVGEDYKWYPGDDIEISVKTENNGDADMENIELSWCLYDTDNNECVISDTENSFDLDSGDSDTSTIQFTINPDDLNSDVRDYQFVVGATGRITEGTNKGNYSCISDYKDISMQVEKNLVILSKINIPDVAQCGSEIPISADVYNIGSKNQEDLSVLITSSALGINKKIDFSKVKSFDKEKLDTTLTIPTGLQEKSYTLNFEVVDSSGDVYQSDKTDVSSDYTALLNVQGSCVIIPTATISATLISGGKAGEQTVIKATIINTGGQNSTTFNVAASGYTDWASSVKLDSNTITLSPGQSKEVSFTFDVNKDVSGDKTFYIEVVSNNEMIVRQPVPVTIQKSSSILSGLSGITGDNWYLWAIGALNIILVIVIIIVAVKVTKRK